MKDNGKIDNNKSYKILSVLFVLTILIFTFINIYEIPYVEEDNAYIGLATLDILEDSAVTVWGGLQKIMGKNVAVGNNEYRDVTAMPGDNYTLADPGRVYEPAVECAVLAKELADSIGADYIYVQSTGKVRNEDDLYPGTIDFSYMKREAVINALLENDIDCIDIRAVLDDCLINGTTDANDWFDFFYRTDHHWRNNAAFEGYRAICKKLENLGYDMNENYMDINQYSKITYENIFLGSHGRMAGPLYTGVDDYELWLPEFETDYNFRVPSEGIYRTGSFEDCFVYYDNLKEYSFDYYAYYAYLNEDYKLIEIENNLNKDAPKILIIRDSAAVPVSVFLASQASEIYMFDLRYLDDNESIMNYIYEKKPDVIMYIFNTGYLANYDALLIR